MRLLFSLLFNNNIRQGNGGVWGRGHGSDHTHTRAKRVSGGGTPNPGAGGETGPGYSAFIWAFILFYFSFVQGVCLGDSKMNAGMGDETVLYVLY